MGSMCLTVIVFSKDALVVSVLQVLRYFGTQDLAILGWRQASIFFVHFVGNCDSLLSLSLPSSPVLFFCCCFWTQTSYWSGSPWQWFVVPGSQFKVSPFVSSRLYASVVLHSLWTWDRLILIPSSSADVRNTIFHSKQNFMLQRLPVTLHKLNPRPWFNYHVPVILL